jgi:acyl carrier protein
MVFKKIKEILSDQLGIDPDLITEETDLIEDLNADSLDIVELITMLEEELDIVITDENAGQFTNVGEIVSYIESLL